MITNVLLISCYELGHQPLSLAWPLAWLKKANIQADTIDLYTNTLDVDVSKEYKFIAISVPMHTALRIGVAAAKKVRENYPAAHICFYGLYASLNADYLLENFANSVLSGEFEEELVTNVQAVLNRNSFESKINSLPIINRIQFPIPERTQLQPLSDYAKYQHGESSVVAGYTESTRGCLHTCAHCPVVPIYQGRFFVVPFETVMADIRQQVIAGAKHITFGDPDFLNAPGHAIKIANAFHTEFPTLTYSFTVKVEHVLAHKDLFQKFAQTGCSFVVTAFESVDDDVLSRLGKGHTSQDMEQALSILAKEGITPHTTWMPFTPWQSIDGYLRLLDWIQNNELVSFVPAVQLSVRMLVPPKSRLLEHEDVSSWAGELDAKNFTYKWTHPDPRMDQLQQEVALIAEENQAQPPYKVFRLIEAATRNLAGLPLLEEKPPTELAKSVPQMTEHWFC